MKAVSRMLLSIIIIVVVIIAAVGIYIWYSSTSGVTETKRVYKIAVLFDVGGKGDLSFNDMAYLGAEKAARELGVKVEYMTPKSLADMEPLLKQLAESKEYDLLILVGFLWTDALNKTADKYPDQKFALIDATTGVTRSNEVDILFREQECGALIGVIASGMAYELGSNTIGAVAGMSIPPLWKFHVGYLFGAKYFELKTNKSITFIWQYTGTFTDTQKGYQTAWQMLQQGARVLYGLAGLTHVGMFDAVIEWNKQGNPKALAIGQDASQEWYSPENIPISGAKRVDVAVYTAIKMVVEDTWKGGIYELGIKEGGVGYWDLDGVRYFAEIAYNQTKTSLKPDEIVNIVRQQREKYIKDYVWNIVRELENKIKNGEIVFKTPMSETEYNEIIQQLMQGNLNAALAKGSI